VRPVPAGFDAGSSLAGTGRGCCGAQVNSCCLDRRPCSIDHDFVHSSGAIVVRDGARGGTCARRWRAHGGLAQVGLQSGSAPGDQLGSDELWPQQDALLAALLAPTHVMFIGDARGVMNGAISERKCPSAPNL
jgi:hypothetical protein